MHFGLPVIAYHSSAVPDTVADGGILVREKRHAELGELIGEVARNQELRAHLIANGKARVKALSYEKFSARVAELFGRDLASRKTAGSSSQHVAAAGL